MCIYAESMHTDNNVVKAREQGGRRGLKTGEICNSVNKKISPYFKIYSNRF